MSIAIKVQSYTEHVQSSCLSSIVQWRNILNPKMADWKVGSGNIKWWVIPDHSLPQKKGTRQPLQEV